MTNFEREYLLCRIRVLRSALEIIKNMKGEDIAERAQGMAESILGSDARCADAPIPQTEEAYDMFESGEVSREGE